MARPARTAAVAVLVTASLSAANPNAITASAVVENTRPNVVIILTDDQRQMDTMHVMPRTRALFGGGGVTYENAYLATPLCCPSRAAIMTGRFNHNNGVRTNQDAEALDQESTLQRSLQDAGYRTALVGKYLNGWPVGTRPPYFHHSLTLVPSPTTYYNNTYNDNGTVGPKRGYQTDVLRDRAVDLIHDDFGAGDATPWFLFLTPFAPHGPWEPRADHANADVGQWEGNPAVFESDRSDKPDHVRNTKHHFTDARNIREKQLRTLLAVDEMVDAVFDALQDEGESNTLAFFLSDNGFMWAEHGLTSKNHPYTESIRTPLMARWPGRLPAGETDDRFVANIDLMPTIADAAGIPADPRYPRDGRSLLVPERRGKFLTEAWTGRGGWASIRAPQYQYVEYYTEAGEIRFREYYDLEADPWQLTNLYGDRSVRNDPYAGALQGELEAARRCSGRKCSAVLDEPPVPTSCGRRLKAHQLVGSPEVDRIRGVGIGDVLCGRASDDRLNGRRGNDLLIGGAGHDVCRGGPGHDRYRKCEVQR